MEPYIRAAFCMGMTPTFIGEAEGTGVYMEAGWLELVSCLHASDETEQEGTTVGH